MGESESPSSVPRGTVVEDFFEEDEGGKDDIAIDMVHCDRRVVANLVKHTHVLRSSGFRTLSELHPSIPTFECAGG